MSERRLRRVFFNGYFRRKLHRAPIWPMVIHAHGFVDGPLIWAARLIQPRIGARGGVADVRHRLARPFWLASEVFEGWQFRRNWRLAKKRGAKIRADLEESAAPRSEGVCG